MSTLEHSNKQLECAIEVFKRAKRASTLEETEKLFNLSSNYTLDALNLIRDLKDPLQMKTMRLKCFLLYKQLYYFSYKNTWKAAL